LLGTPAQASKEDFPDRHRGTDRALRLLDGTGASGAGSLLKSPAMTPADEYRRLAADCLQAAKLANREDVRRALMSLAERWNERAEHLERESI
jgi:hypothetical protein